MRLLKLEVCLQPVGLEFGKIFPVLTLAIIFKGVSILPYINYISNKYLVSEVFNINDEISPCERLFFFLLFICNGNASDQPACLFHVIFQCYSWYVKTLKAFVSRKWSTWICEVWSINTGQILEVASMFARSIGRCGYARICQWQSKLLF